MKNIKPKRQKILLEIIGDGIVETQGGITKALRQRGVTATQATVSRDIKELKIAKSAVGDGRYRYTPPGKKIVVAEVKATAAPETHDDGKENRLLEKYIVGVDFSDSLVIIKTMPAAANLVASALEEMKLNGAVGTIAGDDTIFIATKPKNAAEEITVKLNGFLQPKKPSKPEQAEKILQPEKPSKPEQAKKVSQPEKPSKPKKQAKNNKNAKPVKPKKGKKGSSNA